MISRHTNFFGVASWLTAILSGVLLCLGLQIFVDYQNVAAQYSNWFLSTNSIAAQNSALNSVNAEARLFQFGLLLLWCAYAGMAAWAFMLYRQVGLKICLLLSCLFSLVFVTGYYSLYAWLSTSIVVFNLTLLLAMLIWIWIACTNKACILPPSYRFRALKPWVIVGFIIVLLQAVVSSVPAILHISHCQFWPYCKSLLNVPANIQAGAPDSGLLLFLSRNFNNHFPVIVCFVYLFALSGSLIIFRHFAPLRRLGLLLLICVSAQCYFSVYGFIELPVLSAPVMQQALVFLTLATLTCLCYRVLSKKPQRRLYI